jgi:hypothetical protein
MRAVFDLPYNPTTLEVKGADYNIVQNNGRCPHFRPRTCSLASRYQYLLHPESFLPTTSSCSLSF